MLLVAGGTAGVRQVFTDGTLTTLVDQIGNVVSITTSGDGLLYAATRSPDLIIQIDPITGAVEPVVGTGTSATTATPTPSGCCCPAPRSR